MLLLKTCPRCRGDMYVNRDIYGDYKECLQCGMMEDIKSSDVQATVAAGSAQRRRKRRAA